MNLIPNPASGWHGIWKDHVPPTLKEAYVHFHVCWREGLHGLQFLSARFSTRTFQRRVSHTPSRPTSPRVAGERLERRGPTARPTV